MVHVVVHVFQGVILFIIDVVIGVLKPSRIVAFRMAPHGGKNFQLAISARVAHCHGTRANRGENYPGELQPIRSETRADPKSTD